MNNNKTLYEILGFSKNGYNDNGEKVSSENIQRARNRLIYGDSIEGSVPSWMHKDIERAYSILSNPTTRKEYDASLLANDISFGNNGDSVVEEIIDAPVETTKPIAPVSSPVETPKVEEPTTEEYDEAVVDLDDYTPSTITTSEEPKPEDKKPEESKPEDKKPEDDIIPISEREKKEKVQKNKVDRPILNKILKVAAYAGSIAILGIPGPIITYFALKKLGGKKLKLHPNKNKKVSEIKTEEARLIAEYNENVDKEINTLLAKPNSNYNLQILKTRYENQVQLLQKRIELKLSEKGEGKHFLKWKLEYVALNNQLKRAKERLKTITQNIETYEKEGKRRNLLSNALNEKLYEKAEEIKEAEKENKHITVKKLNVRKERYKKARDLSVKGLRLTRKAVGKVQDGAIRVWDNVRSVKAIFTPDDELTGYIPETTEEKSAKTR